jgi:hypothetical protein
MLFNSPTILAQVKNTCKANKLCNLFFLRTGISKQQDTSPKANPYKARLKDNSANPDAAKAVPSVSSNFMFIF